MTGARLALAAAAVAVLVLLGIGLAQLAGSAAPRSSVTALSGAQLRASLRGSPAPLAALHAQAGELLPGGSAAVRARIAALRGHAVVINKWASWCVPCRSEFAAFQQASARLGREVAFLGVDSADSSRADALAFLRSHPVSYPSYYDPSGEAGSAITDSSFTPVTVFLDAGGRQYIHQGPYPNQDKLERDVRRYALEA
jgi:cytochrome c biogenesis protein CcmG, thiol:disulfide interchange protein DsbE